jgi:hypothetical protein
MPLWNVGMGYLPSGLNHSGRKTAKHCKHNWIGQLKCSVGATQHLRGGAVWLFILYLLKINRSYLREEETENWQLQRVFDYLISRLWQRRVDKAGQISFFSQAYSVGKAYVGKTVTIRLDSQNQEWLIESEQGNLLRSYPSQELSSERIFSFSLSKRVNMVSHDMV